MPFGAHETMEVHEILNEKINMINHFAFYAKQCQNQQVKQMIDHQLQTAMQSYDQMVSYTHDFAAANNIQNIAGVPNVNQDAWQQIQYGLRSPQPQIPQIQGHFNDQQILQSMLSCHKNSAKNQVAACVECADPNLRQMMMNGAMTCANQAYEVFLLMNQQGLYQVPTMMEKTAKTYLHTYQPTQAQAQTQIPTQPYQQIQQ